MHAKVPLGVGKGVLFREVSSVQGCPYHCTHRKMKVVSLNSCLVSRQPPSPTPLLTYQESETVVEKAEGAVNEMTSFDGASKKWGGDLRAWLMAGTYQKLKKAIKKGVKELQWQR